MGSFHQALKIRGRPVCVFAASDGIRRDTRGCAGRFRETRDRTKCSCFEGTYLESHVWRRGGVVERVKFDAGEARRLFPTGATKLSHALSNVACFHPTSTHPPPPFVRPTPSCALQFRLRIEWPREDDQTGATTTSYCSSLKREGLPSMRFSKPSESLQLGDAISMLKSAVIRMDIERPAVYSRTRNPVFETLSLLAAPSTKPRSAVSLEATAKQLQTRGPSSRLGCAVFQADYRGCRLAHIGP
jgi:hypothetical protein